MPVIEICRRHRDAGVADRRRPTRHQRRHVDVATLFGVLTAFTVYVTRFFDPIRDLVMQYTMFQRAMAGGERIFEVLDTKPRIVDKPDAIELDDVEGRVDFDHVDFHYVEGVPVLQDIDLHVKPGETSPSSATPAPARRRSRRWSAAATR